MTNQYAAIATIDNLERAFRWLISNPEATYKAYFRDSYAAYSISRASNLSRLRADLLKNRYAPSAASRVHLPKASGITRQFTLLSVTDQVVYQAAVNLVADRLVPKVRRYHHQTVFGNIPAGKSSIFFYKKWQSEYRLYSRAVMRAIGTGHPYIATFDLTAFYDSIDHHVLGYFLFQLGFDAQFIDFLQRCLRKWTSTNLPGLRRPLELHHGIPQGPIASGLLSEVVLQHVDRRATASSTGHAMRNPRYVRYVDDIRVVAQSELEVQRRLVRLDYAAKEIGLFPQATKIDIHRVVNSRDEVKSISGPQTLPEGGDAVDDSAVRSIMRTTRRGVVRAKDRTRLKYLIGQAPPNYRLSQRLLLVLSRQPELHAQVNVYFARYPVLPTRVVRLLVAHLQSQEIYQGAHALMLLSMHANVQVKHRRLVADFCQERIASTAADGMPLDPPYQAALLSWLIADSRLSPTDLQGLLSPTVDWWLQKTCLAFVNVDQFGLPSYSQLLHDLVKSESEDVARAAAVKIVEDGIAIPSDIATMNPAGQLLLKGSGPPCSSGSSSQRGRAGPYAYI